VVSVTPRSHFTPGKDPVPIVQGWVGPRAGLDGRKISPPSGIRSPDRPARGKSLYRATWPTPECSLKQNLMQTNFFEIYQKSHLTQYCSTIAHISSIACAEITRHNLLSVLLVYATCSSVVLLSVSCLITPCNAVKEGHKIRF